MAWSIFLTIVATASMTQIAVWLKGNLLATTNVELSLEERLADLP